MGMVVVAFWAASEATTPAVTMTSTLSCTNSDASPGTSSAVPPAGRGSTSKFWPSIQASSCSVSKNILELERRFLADELALVPRPARLIPVSLSCCVRRRTDERYRWMLK